MVADPHGHDAFILRAVVNLCFVERSRSVHLFIVLRVKESLARQSDDDREVSVTPSIKPQTRFRRLINKAFLIIFGILLGVLMAEICLRILGYSYQQFYTPDASLGYVLRPNIEGWYRKEGASYVRISSEGLRDREHSIVKPPDTIRIAVLGDSYAEAMHVPMENTFWMILEKKLQDCGAFGGKKIEVINFGVSGYGTAQELLMLRERVWQYSPDVVLLAVTTNTDVTDNSRALGKAIEVPYFVYREGKLTLDDSFKETRAFRMRQSALSRFGVWLQDHSRLIQAISSANRSFKYWLATRRAQGVAANSGETKPAAPIEEPGIENVVYRQPNDEVWNDAWRVTEELIVQMRDEVRARNTQFLVVTLSNGIQVYPDPRVRQTFMKLLGVGDLFYPDNRIWQLCEREHIPAVILAPRLQEYADQNKALLHGFDGKGNGHWNNLGHRVAGELIAGEFCCGVLR